MNNPTTIIYFDYGGYYEKIGVDYQWVSKDNRTYGISMEKIDYLSLVDKICKKLVVDKSTTKKLKLSYTPLTVTPQTQSCITDDDDVYVYLMSMDKDLRRSILHVEVIKDLKIVQLDEQLSRVERGSSDGLNYSDLNLGGVNVDASTLYTCDEPTEQQYEPVENIVIGDGEKASNDNVSGDNVDNNIDGVENSLAKSGMPECVEFPHVGEECQFVDPWDDGIGLELGQEFESKEAVQDLVLRASHQNCFGFSVANSDTNRYVVKCCAAKEGCKWYLRAVKLKDSMNFSVRVYNKIHTCSRASSSANTRKVTRRLVATILHEDYRDELATLTPKSLISLLQEKNGVQVSYSTALRGKKQAVKDMHSTSEENSLSPSYSKRKRKNPIDQVEER